MTTKKDEWTVDTAMEIMQHPTVDSKVWSEAVEWLMLYGPPEIREMLQQASSHATQGSFPDLTPVGFTPNGEPCYTIGDLAKSLGISEEEAAKSIADKEQEHGMRQLFGEQETHKVQ